MLPIVNAALLLSFRLLATARYAVYSVLSLVFPFIFQKLSINQPRPTNVVLVSGTSSGIGRHLALHLARRGFTVLAGVRRQEDGESLLKELNDTSGLVSGALVPLLLDVTKDESVQKAVDTVKALLESSPAPENTRLIAVVNNAGVSPPPCPVEMLDLKSMDRVMTVNLHGVIRLTQAFLPLLRQAADSKRGGYGASRIVNISSANGFMAVPGLGSYVASKFAMEGLTDCLRVELRPQGIHCAIIQPGPVVTPIFSKAITQPTPIRDSLTPELRKECQQKLYKQYLFGYGAEKSMEGMVANFAVDVELTTAQIEHAICSPFPAVRYRTGPLAHGMQLIKSIAPDDVVDAVWSGLYRAMGALS